MHGRRCPQANRNIDFLLAATSRVNRTKAANAAGVDRLQMVVLANALQRERLERLCRYVTRAAICLERPRVDAAGRVIHQLKHPFRDGTTHIVFSPRDFMARLAALVPRPRANLIRYHGVFARGGLPHSCKLRHLIVPRSSAATRGKRREAAQRCPAAGSPGGFPQGGANLLRKLLTRPRLLESPTRIHT